MQRFGLLMVDCLAGENPGPQLIWSVSPLSPAELSSPIDVWVDIPDTSVAVELPNEAVVVISYDVSVMHLDSLDAADEIGELSVRVLVDHAPYRQSASTVDDREPLVTVVSGHLILEIPGGHHDVALQWRKRGNRVRKWVVMSDILDGFAGGRNMVVSAQHRFVWYTQPLNSARLVTMDTWEPVPDMTVSFRLADVATVRIFYQLPVRPEFVRYARGSFVRFHRPSQMSLLIVRVCRACSLQT